MKWFRFYSEFRTDPKLNRMPINHRYAFVVLLCLASDSSVRGLITGLDSEDLAYELEMPCEDWLTLRSKFKAKGLIDFDRDSITICNWDKRQFASDTSADRVARHREKVKKQVCNVTETLVKRHVTGSDPDPDPDPDPKQNTIAQDELERVGDSGEKAKKPKKSKPDTNPDFQVFWAAYPRKKNKQDALRAYKALIAKRASPEAINKLLAVRIRFDWLDRIIDHIPYPASFLRAEDFFEAVEAAPSLEITLVQQTEIRAVNEKQALIEQMRREIEAELALEASYESN